MGAFHCKSCQNGEDNTNIFSNHPSTESERRRFLFGRQRIRTGSLKQTDSLVLQTLSVIKNLGLIDNGSEAPEALRKLHWLADDGEGWIQVVLSMIHVIPLDDPLSPALITVILDDCPLPDKDTIIKLSFMLDLSNKTPKCKTIDQHRNICVILGILADKLPGPSSIALLTKETLTYLFNNMNLQVHPSIILFSLIALEKFAQIRENRYTIERFMKTGPLAMLTIFERLTGSDQPLYAQVGFCAEWLLDNIFVDNQRSLSYINTTMEGVNAILNQEDASEYLKLGPSGLEARCDACSFESVRCTFQIDEGTWYYEVTILTSGVMQIGWSTKNSKFFNHDGYGIGDDEHSVAYDGCRQLVWYGARCTSCVSGRSWKEGDTVGCLLRLETPSPCASFYLNGQIVASNDKIFQFAKSEFFAAASFMTFQQSRFNFGSKPFKYAPKGVKFNIMNTHGKLDDTQKIILPKRMRLELLGKQTADEDSCTICFDRKADVIFYPCKHDGYCKNCAQQLTLCPVCRQIIVRHQEINDRSVIAPTTKILVS
ncbi:RING finger and SPRY domain-containing protein 1-like [Daktulosphaira vitifoliae]|uniref:RING finger and SPRY domain-containing protein 1-like n=1 Tax=Daktulosphaira vitifoliae TaxID=58002 RepID=UPI0021AADA1B|nr:RING finger and SPRY domain-containing protein 1-like [Daktulosphaira vitifoliae]